MKRVRIGKPQYYLQMAKVASLRSTCLRRCYGCVIINNDEVVATGYNGSPRGETNCSDTGICERQCEEHNSGNYGNCKAVHAEQNAMLSASRAEMIGATMYLAGYEYNESMVPESIEDCEPCPICMRMIKNSGITKVINEKGVVWERNGNN